MRDSRGNRCLNISTKNKNGCEIFWGLWEETSGLLIVQKLKYVEHEFIMCKSCNESKKAQIFGNFFAQN